MTEHPFDDPHIRFDILIDDLHRAMHNLVMYHERDRPLNAGQHQIISNYMSWFRLRLDYCAQKEASA